VSRFLAIRFWAVASSRESQTLKGNSNGLQGDKKEECFKGLRANSGETAFYNQSKTIDKTNLAD